MYSIKKRLTLVQLLVLIAFLGFTGVSLNRAFTKAASQARIDRLQGQIFTILAATDVIDGKVVVSENIPEQRFYSNDSGLYSFIKDDKGNEVWSSQSAIGEKRGDFQPLPPDQYRQQEISVGSDESVFVLSYGISWQDISMKEIGLTFAVAEDGCQYYNEIGLFEKNLWGWLLFSGLVLLVTQFLALMWGLNPLAAVAGDLYKIHSGKKKKLDGDYPSELIKLTGSINTLIDNERSRMENYRNTLANLAHSLKTPLAVIRGITEAAIYKSKLIGNDKGQDILEQIERMDDMVAYQLSRAATSSHITYSKAIQVNKIVRKLVSALNKVYSSRKISIDVQCSDEIFFHGIEGDLMELCGNLLDNACKWSESKVEISFSVLSTSESNRTGFLMTIEDDGKGISEAEKERILRRGERDDQKVSGHGIGLAVVKELVDSYRGEICITSGELGGALFEIKIPAR
ncbi:MAG: GHKL domain-containing protein [Gammaproteobacteria bacterium]|nr:MAG: GHKL domain-containing protein [Gammaproteobacteria bacterium]